MLSGYLDGETTVKWAYENPRVIKLWILSLWHLGHLHPRSISISRASEVFTAGFTTAGCNPPVPLPCGILWCITRKGLRTVPRDLNNLEVGEGIVGLRIRIIIGHGLAPPSQRSGPSAPPKSTPTLPGDVRSGEIRNRTLSIVLDPFWSNKNFDLDDLYTLEATFSP